MGVKILNHQSRVQSSVESKHDGSRRAGAATKRSKIWCMHAMMLLVCMCECHNPTTPKLGHPQNQTAWAVARNVKCEPQSTQRNALVGPKSRQPMHVDTNRYTYVYSTWHIACDIYSNGLLCAIIHKQHNGTMTRGGNTKRATCKHLDSNT